MAGAPVELLPRDCIRKADSIESIFASFNLPIEPQSGLALMLSEIRWLGGFDSIFGAAVQADKDRALKALLFFSQIDHIENALRRATEIPGIRDRLKHLRRNPLNFFEDKTGQALEIGFEIEVAHRLLFPYWMVCFAEPDIVLEAPVLGRIGIACKRPRGIQSVGASIEDAARQIEVSGFPGYIFVSVDGFAETWFRSARTQEHLQQLAIGRIQAISSRSVQAVSRSFDRGVWGIIYCGWFYAMVAKPSSHCWKLGIARIPNLGVPHAGTMIDLIIDAFRGALSAQQV
jgi:hypothetical protein